MSELVIDPNNNNYIFSSDKNWSIRVGSILRLEIHEDVDAKDKFRFYLVIVILTGGIEQNILFDKFEKKEEAEARRVIIMDEIEKLS